MLTLGCIRHVAKAVIGFGSRARSLAMLPQIPRSLHQDAGIVAEHPETGITSAADTFPLRSGRMVVVTD